jgi:DNA-binding transcriptional regulator YiaG
MSNLGSILKSEIARLSRRSLRPLCIPIKKDVSALKRSLAQHKRLLAQLSRDNARLMADLNSKLAAPPTAPAEVVDRARLGPSLILSQRKRLGLSRSAFAKLLGVSGGAVVAWEGGRSKPRAAARAALIAVRQLGKRQARQRLAAVLGSNGKSR